MADMISFDCLGNLIQRSLSGDQEAFGVIVRQYQGMVSGITFGMTGDFHKSEDIAQETFLVAWKKLSELRDVQKFPLWLCGIARNLVKNDRSRNTSKQVALVSDSEHSMETASNAAEPIDQMIREERNRLIIDAIARIPETYRIPLMMSIRSGMTTTEIAFALKISEETLYQRISRAKKYLRSELEKQVEGAIRATGPGEFFTVAVLAALPVVTTLSSTGNVAAATVMATEPTWAAAPPSGSSSLFGAATSIGAAVQSIIAVVGIVAFWGLLAAGGLSGVWFSVRNAVTLKARRYLILVSLHVHLLFALACSGAFLFVTGRTILFNMYDGMMNLELTFMYYNLGFYIAGILLSGVTLFMLFQSSYIYRRILREEAGLIAPQNNVPLEKSFLSFNRLRRTFFRSAIILFVLYALVFIAFLFGCNTVAINTYSVSWQESFYYNSTMFLIVAFLFFLIFLAVHRRFIAIAKDEAAFSATPPIIRQDMAFRSKVFLDWVASYGIFLAAGLLVILTEGSRLGWLPRTPFVLLLFLFLISGITFGAAAINARFPFWRWLTTFAGLVLLFLITKHYFYLSMTLRWTASVYYPFQNFFDTPQSWFVVFAVMILDAVAIYVLFATFILGYLYIRAKAFGKSMLFSQRTIGRIYGFGIAVILMASPFVNSYAKNDYFFFHVIVRQYVSLTNEHAERMITLMEEIPQTKTEKFRYYKLIHGELYLQSGQYDKAIADFDEVLDIANGEEEGRNKRILESSGYLKRGQAKLAKGDYQDALEDFNKITTEENGYGFLAEQKYHRGFAHEKLGETKAAKADYSEAIRHLERFAEPPSVYAIVPRPGCNQERRYSKRVNTCGYELTFDNLKAIRDSLE